MPGWVEARPGDEARGNQQRAPGGLGEIRPRQRPTTNKQQHKNTTMSATIETVRRRPGAGETVSDKQAAALLRMGINKPERRFVMVGYWLTCPWQGGKDLGEVIAYSADETKVKLRMFGTSIKHWVKLSDVSLDVPPTPGWRLDDFTTVARMLTRICRNNELLRRVGLSAELKLALEKRNEAIAARLSRISRSYNVGNAALVVYAGGGR